MATGFDIWGVVASVIGFLSIFQIIAAFINSRLPLNRLQALEETLRETEALLVSVEEEGLFDDRGVYLSQVKRQVSNICNRIKRVRNDAFAAQTYADELKQWWSGISNEISVCYKEVRHLRANISTTSSEARKALAQRQAELEVSIPERDKVEDAVSENTTNNDSSPQIHGDAVASLSAEKARTAFATGQSGITTQPFIAGPTQDHDAQSHSLGVKADEVTLERCTAAESSLEKMKDGVPPSGLEAQVAIVVLPTSQSDSTDTLPSYRRQSSLPIYPSFTALTTTVLPRCTITSADAARATHKLVKAYRRKLMVHNVPWQSPGEPHARHHGISAAASARDVDRPSNTTRHWKLLEARAKATLRTYVAVLSHEATLVSVVTSTGTVEAGPCSDSVQRTTV